MQCLSLFHFPLTLCSQQLDFSYPQKTADQSWQSNTKMSAWNDSVFFLLHSTVFWVEAVFKFGATPAPKWENSLSWAFDRQNKEAIEWLLIWSRDMTPTSKIREVLIFRELFSCRWFLTRSNRPSLWTVSVWMTFYQLKPNSPQKFCHTPCSGNSLDYYPYKSWSEHLSVPQRIIGITEDSF